MNCIKFLEMLHAVLRSGNLLFAAFHVIYCLALNCLKAQVDLLSLQDASTIYDQLPIADNIFCSLDFLREKTLNV